MRVTLRDYQEEAVARTDAAEAAGVTRQLGVAATGLGKTIIFSAVAERRACRTLVLAHRDELIEQAVAKLREVWPEVDVGVVKAARNEIGHHVVVASVQTLSRPDRLAQLLDPQYYRFAGMDPLEPFGLVVVDEAHHATAKSYGAILSALRAGEPAGLDEEFGEPYPAGPLLLGVTATPDRGDGKGLVDVFDEVVWSYDILWGIRSGFLCDLRGLRVRLDALNLSDVRVSRGDYQAGDTGRALLDAGAPLSITRAYVEHALGRRTLVFTPTVAMAEETAEAFRSLGVRAAWISGETATEVRRHLLREFADGGLDVMVNCMVLTEGYDNPRVDCVIVARPTRSRALYTQMVGRGTRRHPDKTDLLVLDVVGATEEHSLVTVPSLFGIEAPEMRDRLGTGAAGVVEVVEDQEREFVRQGRLRAEEVKLFARVAAANVAWVKVHADGAAERRYVCQLGKGLPTVVLVHRLPDREDGWLAGYEDRDGSKHVLIREVAMEMAQGVAEDYARKNGTGHLVEADAPWRDGKPTAKQRQLAKQLKLETIRGESRGDLSARITAELARKKAERAAAKAAKAAAG